MEREPTDQYRHRPGGRSGLGLAVAAMTLCAGAAPAASIVTFETGKTPTSEIHVATTGSDTTGNGTAGNPYATVGRAAAVATPGAAIRIHAGTYAGGTFIDGLAGTSLDPVWIGGAPGEPRPVIQGGAEGLHLSRVRYLVVHDLEVRQATANGINADDGGEVANPEATRHLVLRDLYIHDIGGSGNQDCLKLSGVHDYFVLDSELAFCGGGGAGSGIDHVGCHRGLVVGNFFHDMSGNAVQAKGGSADVEIRANRIVAGGQRALNIGGSTGFSFFRPPLSLSTPNAEARDIRVIANVIEGSVVPLAFVGAVDSLAAHNTMVAPTNWLLRILQETTTSGGYTFLPCGNNTVANNLFYFDRSDLSTWVNLGPGTDPTSFTFTHDLWYAYDDPAQSQPNLPVPETGGVVGQDPLLRSVTGHDYRLLAGSPAAGAGLTLPAAPVDFTGAHYSAPPSIGAFEYDVIFRDGFE